MVNFGTVPRGTYGKLCPKPLPVLTPRVHMGPIGEAAVPRRSAEPPPPRSPKDVPNDLSLRNLIPYSRCSASLASFSSCTLSNSAFFPASRFPFPAVPSPGQLSKRQPTPIQTLHSSLLAVPAPRRCLSYILLRSSGPRWPPYQLYLTRCPRSLTAQLERLYTACPVHKMCTSPLVARLNTGSNANTHCQDQARYIDIVLGCGSFVRGRKRKKGDSIPLYINE